MRAIIQTLVISPQAQLPIRKDATAKDTKEKEPWKFVEMLISSVFTKEVTLLYGA